MRRSGAVIVLSLALVALALLLAACGGGDEEAPTTTSPASSAGSAAPSVGALPPGFVECMADQGVDLEAAPDLNAAVHSPEGDRCFNTLHGG